MINPASLGDSYPASAHGIGHWFSWGDGGFYILRSCRGNLSRNDHCRDLSDAGIVIYAISLLP